VYAQGDQTAAYATLKWIDLPEASSIIVATSQLIGSPQYQGVAVWQADQLRELLYHLEETDDTASIVLAVDLNATPGSQQYQTLTTGPPGLRSAMLQATGSEPPFTMASGRHRETVDFVLINGQPVVSAVAEVRALAADVASGIPSAAHGSDHVPLVIDLMCPVRGKPRTRDADERV
jgi:endonuclease/exonuclease/phosphatase (EEP) superfamily protein YafD